MISAGFLRQSDIFFDLDEAQLEWIAAICREQGFASGQIIFEENSASDELYIILRGEVEILIDPSLVSDQPEAVPRPTTIATLRRGQSFGEVALVDQGLRSASARSASHDTLLLVVPRDSLMALCGQHPDLGFRLMRNLAAELAVKIRSTDLRMREELLYTQRPRRQA
ncbi:MAG: cyclic nucleotide-binding domain-containing protein [Anaerolineales bacterium]|nr:cyclic nucleotide-binding domain-containing protein [Anaerolineales bacterium]